MLAGTRSAMWAWTVMAELKRAILRRAASALGRDSRASASSKRTWRWRLEGSTKSRSMRVRVPTPARARREAVAAPVAPHADDGDVGGGEELLAGGADAGEEDLAGVAVVIGDAGGSGGWLRRRWQVRWRARAGVGLGVRWDAEGELGCLDMMKRRSAKRRCSFVV